MPPLHAACTSVLHHLFWSLFEFFYGLEIILGYVSVHAFVLLSRNLCRKWEFDHSEYFEQLAANRRALDFDIFFLTKAKFGRLKWNWSLWQVVRGFELGWVLFWMCFLWCLSSNKVVFPTEMTSLRYILLFLRCLSVAHGCWGSLKGKTGSY